MTTLTFSNFRIIKQHVHGLRIDGKNVIFNRVVVWREKSVDYIAAMKGDAELIGPGIEMRSRWEVVEVLDLDDFNYWEDVHEKLAKLNEKKD